MSEFRLLNTNRFYLPGTGGEYLHLASISYGLKEYMCFANTRTQEIYIEAITGGQLEFIEDNSLVESIAKFLEDKQVTLMSKPLLPDKVWYKKPIK